MPNGNKELRFLSKDIKGNKKSRKVSGYASIYDAKSKTMDGFKEVVQRGAFDNFAEISQDLIANIDHKDDKILARYGTNLKLESNPVGLYFEFEVPKTTYGNDLLVNVRSGNINKCSFAFTVNKETWGTDEDGTPLRTLHSFKELHDIAIVTTPAYDDTTVALRSMKKNIIDAGTKKRIAIAKSYE